RRRQVLLALPRRTLRPLALGRRVTRGMHRLPARRAVRGRGFSRRVTAHRADQRTPLGPLLLRRLRLERGHDLRGAVRTGHRHRGVLGDTGAPAGAPVPVEPPQPQTDRPRRWWSGRRQYRDAAGPADASRRSPTHVITLTDEYHLFIT